MSHRITTRPWTRTCYFLLNFVHIRTRTTTPRSRQAILLFSFEFCAIIIVALKRRGNSTRTCYFLLNFVHKSWKPCNHKSWRKTCYFLLNFVEEKKCIRRKRECHLLLLFSFEFCLSERGRRFVSKYLNTCYFLLNFVTHFQMLRISSNPKTALAIFFWILWAFHPWYRRARVWTCYFLLNFVCHCQSMKQAYSR